MCRRPTPASTNAASPTAWATPRVSSHSAPRRVSATRGGFGGPRGAAVTVTGCLCPHRGRPPGGRHRGLRVGLTAAAQPPGAAHRGSAVPLPQEGVPEDLQRVQVRGGDVGAEVGTCGHGDVGVRRCGGVGCGYGGVWGHGGVWGCGVGTDGHRPHGKQWVPLGSNGCHWGAMGATGDQWVPLGSNGEQWVPLGINECHWGAMGATGDQWVPLRSNGCHWGSMGAIGEQWGPPGMYGHRVSPPGDPMDPTKSRWRPKDPPNPYGSNGCHQRGPTESRWHP